jgi:recombination associated protein RdgC
MPEEKLAKLTMQPCGNMDRDALSWVLPRGDDRLHLLNQQVLITLGREAKLLPSSVVNQFAEEKAAEIEEQQGFMDGRKQMRELKEQIADELLPRAFERRRTIWAWIDPEFALMIGEVAKLLTEVVAALVGEKSAAN